MPKKILDPTFQLKAVNSRMGFSMVLLWVSFNLLAQPPIGTNADEMLRNIERRDEARIGTQFPPLLLNRTRDNTSNIGVKQIKFYFIWYDCGQPCINQFKILNDIKTRYEHRVDFISMTYHDEERQLELLSENPLNFRNYSIVQTELAITGYPFSYPTSIITVNGVIKYFQSGGPSTLEKAEEYKSNYIIVLDRLIQ